MDTLTALLLNKYVSGGGSSEDTAIFSRSVVISDLTTESDHKKIVLQDIKFNPDMVYVAAKDQSSTSGNCTMVVTTILYPDFQGVVGFSYMKADSSQLEKNFTSVESGGVFTIPSYDYPEYSSDTGVLKIWCAYRNVSGSNIYYPFKDGVEYTIVGVKLSS